jgi:hypothetical protein
MIDGLSNEARGQGDATVEDHANHEDRKRTALTDAETEMRAGQSECFRRRIFHMMDHP